MTVTHAQEEEPIKPHLGYGIHFAPNTDASPDDIAALGMDWVKIYEPTQAKLFASRRVLYRIDVFWPTDWDYYKRDLTERIRGVASLPIDAVEIGNEPNLRSENGNRNPNAWEYTQLLRVSYQVIKATAPKLIVVSGGLAPTVTTPDRAAVSDLEFAKEMLENGAAQWMDAFGYHPYGYNLAPEADPAQHELVFRRTERIRAIMEANNVYKQVWLTEFGWLRDPAEDGINCQDNNPRFQGFAWLRVSGDTQADYLARAFQYAHENWPWAGPMFVWNLNWNRMSWLDMCDHTRWFGLIRLNGERTSAFQRLQRMRHYYSTYTPTLEVKSEEMIQSIGLTCAGRVEMGSFRIVNIGYPGATRIAIQPMNGESPPYIEVEPTAPRVGQRIKVVVDATGVQVPGQYPFYINVRFTVAGRLTSQSIRAYLTIKNGSTDCSTPN